MHGQQNIKFGHTFEDQTEISNEVGTTLLSIIKQSYVVQSCYNVTVNICTPTIPSYRGGPYGFPFEPCVNIFRTSHSVCCRQKEGGGGIALLAAKLKDTRHTVFCIVMTLIVILHKSLRSMQVFARHM